MHYRFIDIETAPQEGFYWDAKVKYISHEFQEQCTTLLCASWKDSNEDMVHNVRVSLDDVRNDKKIVGKLNQLLQECADKNIILVYQNGDRFDYRKIRARSRVYDLPPLPELKTQLRTIDTLKEAKKAAHDYNRLDYLGKEFGGLGKVETRGWLMWRDIVSRHTTKAKQRKALKEMVEYCDGDILALECVFNRLKKDIKLPNFLLYNGMVDGCPNCGSKTYVKRGIRYTMTRAYQSYQCQSCHKRFQDTKSMKGVMFK